MTPSLVREKSTLREKALLYSYANHQARKGEGTKVVLQPLTLNKKDKADVLSFFLAYADEQEKDDPVRIDGGKRLIAQLTDELFIQVPPEQISSYLRTQSNNEMELFNLGLCKAWLVQVGDSHHAVGLVTLDSAPTEGGYFEWSITLLKSAQGQGIGTRCIRFITSYVDQVLLNQPVVSVDYELSFKPELGHCQLMLKKDPVVFQGLKARILLNNIGSVILHRKQGFEVGKICLSKDMNGIKKPCVFMYYPCVPAELKKDDLLKAEIKDLVDRLMDKSQRTACQERLQSINDYIKLRQPIKVDKQWPSDDISSNYHFKS